MVDLMSEIATYIKQAHGDLAILVGLLALRKVEAGRAGRELGVLSVHAPTLDDQARVAAESFHAHETRRYDGSARGVDGLYTPAFLVSFSHRWAPIQGATNDPHGLNANHAPNLTKYYGEFSARAGKLITKIPQEEI